MLSAEEVESCRGSVSGSTITTPSWPQSAESPAVKEQEGLFLGAAHSLSGAQRVKKVSRSNRE